MKLYIYASSGHNKGLEMVRRCAVLAKKLAQFDPLLCTADYRAATYARNELGIYKSAGIDVIGNLPNTMEHKDALIFESDEPSDFMVENMREFCSLLYIVGQDIPNIIVDEEVFIKGDDSIEKCLYFGDDDYSDQLLKMVDGIEKQDITCLMGHYHFFGNEDKLKPYFNEVIDEEEYFDTIRNSCYLLSGSYQSACESLQCGNKPVLLKRADKTYSNTLNIPEIEMDGKSLPEIIDEFNKIVANYPSDVKQIEPLDLSEITSKIDARMKLMESVAASGVFE
jgi:hypothetical protein